MTEAAFRRTVPSLKATLLAVVLAVTGLSSSGSSDLWLENNAGVIMHLEGTSSGAMLTLGKDEIFIRMNQ
jgi:hypothetical protein